jgi:hypothetical protein
MRIGKNQRYVLQELKRIKEKNDCELIYSADLILHLYYPNFFNDDFDDYFKDPRFHRTPEYVSARACLSQSMRRLVDSGLVEKGKITGPLEGIAGHAYKITEKGLKVLSTRNSQMAKRRLYVQS